jgi:cardiolipin synthase
MPAEVCGTNCNWLCKGDEFFAAMFAAIEGAQHTILLETYTFAPDALGDRFREALVRAAGRGTRVRVLVDALGSFNLPGNYFEPLTAAGGQAQVFNPIALGRLGIRNHRKLLVADEQIAFVGGFNISAEYEGDGIQCGWCDVGLKMEGPLAAQLAGTFDEMWERADLKHKAFITLRKSGAKRTLSAPDEQLLLSGPGRERSPIKTAFAHDLARASSVHVMVAYFLPTWRLRRQLTSVALRGGKVQVILPGKSDVAISQLAARSLYRRFLRAGVEIHEYQPQILHAKLFIIDDVVYVGSANLDQRSLNLNYELLIRFDNPEMARQAREVFATVLQNCRAVKLEQWKLARTFWQRLKQRWAYFLLVRVDPYVARRQWMALPD